jgi:hypothetical protein
MAVKKLRFLERLSNALSLTAVASLLVIGTISVLGASQNGPARFGDTVRTDRHPMSLPARSSATGSPVPPAPVLKATDARRSDHLAADQVTQVAPLVAQASGPATSHESETRAQDAPLPVIKTETALPAQPVDTQWPSEIIVSAKAECMQRLDKVKIDWDFQEPMRQGVCGTPAPISLRAFGTPRVALVPPALTNCAVASALSRWVADVVQPAAQRSFQSTVTRLLVAGAYQCRNRNGASDGPLSEHALANAIDISGFELANGRTVRVSEGWGKTKRDAVTTGEPPTPAKSVEPAAGSPKKGKPATHMALGGAAAPKYDGPADPVEQTFLRGIHQSACAIFGTVLGPEANEFHRDHFHLDMKVRKHIAFCE